MATIRAFDLDNDELRMLEEDGVVGPSVGGKRKVSLAILSPPSSIGSGSSSSSEDLKANLKTIFGEDVLKTVPLQETSESIAALENWGFSHETAIKVYNRWASRPPSPDDLIDYALGHIEMLGAPQFRDLPTEQAMIEVGISEELASALLDPMYNQLFKSESLHYWIKDTIRLRYAAFRQIEDQVQSTATFRTIAKRGQGHKRGKLSDSSLFAPNKSTPLGSKPTKMNAAGAAGASKASTATHVAAESASRDGYITVYKGKGLYAEDPINQHMDGRLLTETLATHRGGDFNPMYAAWYWTKERETAEVYRDWAVRRSIYSQTCICKLEIKEEDWKALRRESLFYSKEWEFYIWHSRKKLSHEIPSVYDKYWKGTSCADVVEGHIAGTGSEIITKIKKEKALEALTEEHVLHIGNRKATQAAIMKPSVMESLFEKGTFEMEFFPCVGADM